MNPNRAILIAIPVILAVVLILTYLQVFSSYIFIGVIFVLYVVVSLVNRRKFRRQANAQPSAKKQKEK